MKMKAGKTTEPRDASVILTYRCPMRCSMCNIWKYPTCAGEEIRAENLRSLPKLKFINLTGGEPFVREDLAEIVEECYRHAPRIVISTSGWYGDRVMELARRYPDIGIRISLEGLKEANDELRGRDGGFERGFATLTGLLEMGVRDIGFACTVSDRNSADMIELYNLSRRMGVEFATAAVHNSFYFHKSDNSIADAEKVAADFHRLATMQLRERNPKSWFRAWFNMGLANYAMGRPRMLPCEAGSSNFFIDPFGEVYPCNGMADDGHPASMGNIMRSSFDEIWRSERAESVRRMVADCPRQCWMVGMASPVMHKYIAKPAGWVAVNKIRSLMGLPPKFKCMKCR